MATARGPGIRPLGWDLGRRRVDPVLVGSQSKWSGPPGAGTESLSTELASLEDVSELMAYYCLSR